MNIYRYGIPFEYGFKTFSMPAGAKIVDAVYQQGRREFSIYAEVPSVETKENRTFHILATGDAVPRNFKHVRTVLYSDQFHVFHIYEEMVPT